MFQLFIARVRVYITHHHRVRFDSSRKTWQAFWSQFESLVDLNMGLQIRGKFNYLTFVVSDDAQKAIAGLQLRAEYYQDLQKERFGNKQNLMQYLLSSLLDIPTINMTGECQKTDSYTISCKLTLGVLRFLMTPATPTPQHWSQIFQDCYQQTL